MMYHAPYIYTIGPTKASKSSRKLPKGKKLIKYLQPSRKAGVRRKSPALHSGLSGSAAPWWDGEVSGRFVSLLLEY